MYLLTRTKQQRIKRVSVKLAEYDTTTTAAADDDDDDATADVEAPTDAQNDEYAPTKEERRAERRDAREDARREETFTPYIAHCLNAANGGGTTTRGAAATSRRRESTKLTSEARAAGDACRRPVNGQRHGDAALRSLAANVVGGISMHALHSPNSQHAATLASNIANMQSRAIVIVVNGIFKVTSSLIIRYLTLRAGRAACRDAHLSLLISSRLGACAQRPSMNLTCFENTLTRFHK